MLAVSLCGCSVSVGTNKYPVKLGTGKEPDMNAVVAHATGGEDIEDMKITYEEFRREYAYVLVNNEIYSDTNLDTYLDAQVTAQRSKAINYLINEQIVVRKAKEYGVYELTAEEQAEVDEEYDGMVAEQIKRFGDAAAAELAASGTSDGETSEGETESVPELSDEEKEKLGREKLDKMLSDCGMTYENLKWWAQSSRIADKLYDEVVKDISDAEVNDGLKELIEESKEMYEKDMSVYFQMGYSEVWLPEDTRLVKHILLGFDTEDRQKIYELRQDGKDDEADKAREEAAAKLEEKRAEVEQKMDDGASLDDLIKEYSADNAGTEANPDGYVVVPNDNRWMAEFTEGAFVPENIGDRTVAVTDYGVHIMVYAGNKTIKDSEREPYKQLVLNRLQQARYSEMMEKWLAEYAYEIDYAALRIEDPNAGASE